MALALRAHFVRPKSFPTILSAPGHQFFRLLMIQAKKAAAQAIAFVRTAFVIAAALNSVLN